jgi:CRP-like cAMP-binding protein
MSETDTAVRQAMAGHGFLAGASARTVELLSEGARFEEFEAGALLLREGERADAVYLLTEGRVAIEIHSPSQGPLVIDIVHPDHVVGLSWVAPPFRWHFDARALERVQAVVLDAPRLFDQLALHPEVAAELHRRLNAVMLSRLQATRIRLLDLYANASRH